MIRKCSKIRDRIFDSDRDENHHVREQIFPKHWFKQLTLTRFATSVLVHNTVKGLI